MVIRERSYSRTNQVIGPIDMRLSGLVGSVLTEQGRRWSLMIFCARATRGLRKPSLDARSGKSISPHP